MENHLKDINNKLSSKRIWANRILWVSVAMVVVYFAVFIGAILLEKKEPIHTFPMEIWLTMFGTGAVALGLTLWEQKK